MSMVSTFIAEPVALLDRTRAISREAPRFLGEVLFLGRSPRLDGAPGTKLPVSRVLRHPGSGNVGHWVSSYSGLAVQHLGGRSVGGPVGTRAALSGSMPKTTKRARRTGRTVTDRSATTDIVSQIECVVRYPQATLIGALVGGLVPWFARTLAHGEVPSAWTSGNTGLAAAMLAVVLGCALFSALTVYKFGLATFGDRRKAVGFTLALEGVMLVSTGATSATALIVLILINALGNGSSIALSRAATCKQREADARRAATRACSRATTPTARAPRASQPAGPIEVVEVPAPVACTPELVRVPRSWSASANTVIDAEIVSEEKIYS